MFATKLKKGATAVLAGIGLIDVSKKVEKLPEDTMKLYGYGLIGVFLILLLRK